MFFLELLSGFGFNGEGPVSSLLKLKVEIKRDRMSLTGLSAKAIRYPKGGKPMQLRAAAANADFEQRSYVLTKAPVLIAKGSRKPTELILTPRREQGMCWCLRCRWYSLQKSRVCWCRWRKS